MLVRLKAAGLWMNQSGDSEICIPAAWRALSRMGLPVCYGDKALNGSFECVVTDPSSGVFIAFGRGKNLERSVCEKALNMRCRFDSS